MTQLAPPTRMHRFEVWKRDRAGDPAGADVARRARDLGFPVQSVRTARVYLIEGELSDAQRTLLRDRLLADPVLEEPRAGASDPLPGRATIEIHPLPGVMDPAALTVQRAASELLSAPDLRVATATRYDIEGLAPDEAMNLARRLLFNPIVEHAHPRPYTPDAFPTLPEPDQHVRAVPLLDLDDDALARLSREGHLFLSQDEMRTLQSHYRALGREPTDIELETLAQTWSEHCVHKTLKSTIRITPPADDVIHWADRPGHDVAPDGAVTIHNLLRSTVAAATHQLIQDGVDWTRSVFVDNAGIIEFDAHHAVCVKVETHNHPSAIEPYGGAATGIGGCIRDIIGTGLAARPIANTDVFCVAPHDTPRQRVPEGCIHPRRVLERVVDGVRDYGNRMGIPTLNGAVYFDPRYIGNPLVFCGCVGVIPNDRTHGDAQPGDLIVALGGRTGRDGIHGATFSSAELTDQHADEFSHAVQIGNAIEEKRVLDAILRARDHHSGCLFSAITDCGAGGFSSAVGEMGERVGAEVHLDRAPLKYRGLRYDEIWISESQERMVLAVPPHNIDALKQICDEEHVELANLGTFGLSDDQGQPELALFHAGREVGRLSMTFLHDGIPMPTRDASWSPPATATAPPPAPDTTTTLRDTLLPLLAHPNIASKRWIIRQYDHEVQGNTVIKPLIGPAGDGPSDAAVIEPVPGSGKGLAIASGLATPFGDPERNGDPYIMALAAVDECVRNLVCVGADPERIAILDNFCWPSCQRPDNLGSLVRAAEGCYDAALAYRTPFISGKDSLNNQFRTKDGTLIEIPPTLLITGVGRIDDITRCVTMDAKPTNNSVLLLVGPTDADPAPSHHAMIRGLPPARVRPFDPQQGARTARAVAALIREGLVLAAHDCSEGGLATAVAEMLIAAHHDDAPSPGADLRLPDVEDPARRIAAWLGESPGRYLLQLPSRDHLDRAQSLLADTPHTLLGVVNDSASLSIEGFDGSVAVAELKHAFLATLDW